MNKYVRAAGVTTVGVIKMTWTKLFHLKSFVGPMICMISPFSEITLAYKGKLHIGKMLKLRDGGKIRVRRGATCLIGDNVNVGSNSMIVCRESIKIGSNVLLAANVQIFDHDHDFCAEGGVKTEQYRSSPIVIGNNVWIGCNSVILRGTVIGDNAVIAAGSIIKGVIPSNSTCIQKRVSEIRQIEAR